ncbi:hypothetical protein [uncultured Maribacter sp.]|uniref:acyltransferase n=1 Tax=uncultured Maribacter sp. TaxID=431308 RepID=UPI00260BA672|nr:hypothetical protein [uncultured Maribacter sp.]
MKKYLIKTYKNIRDGYFFKKSISKKISGKENQLKIDTSCRFINCKLIISGKFNTINIQENCIFKNVTFYIKGNNNTIHIAESVQFNRAGEIWVEDDHCKLFIDHSTTFENTHLAITEPNSKMNIGANCMFSNDIDVRTGDSHSIIDNTTQERINYAKNVTIGNHVWVGAHTSILKGASIANDSIVATRSVVTNSHENPNSILAGMPAKEVKQNINWDRKRFYKKE